MERTEAVKETTVLTSTEMTYDEANCMVTFNGEDVRYDADGNMTYGSVDGQMCELTYDCRNRLIQAGDIVYIYDAENIRTGVETDRYTEEYTVDRVSGLTQILEIERTYKNENSEGMMRILPTAGQRKKHTTMEMGWYMRRKTAVMLKQMVRLLITVQEYLMKNPIITASRCSYTTTTTSAAQP